MDFFVNRAVIYILWSVNHLVKIDHWLNAESVEFVLSVSQRILTILDYYKLKSKAWTLNFPGSHAEAC